MDRRGSPVATWCGPSMHSRVTSSIGTCVSKMERACAIYGVSSQRKIQSISINSGEGLWQKDRKAEILISAWQENFFFADQSADYSIKYPDMHDETHGMAGNHQLRANGATTSKPNSSSFSPRSFTIPSGLQSATSLPTTTPFWPPCTRRKCPDSSPAGAKLSAIPLRVAQAECYSFL